MKKLLLLFLILLILGLGFYYYTFQNKKVEPLIKKITEKPLEKYSFENLRKKEFNPVNITLGEILKDQKDFVSYIFYFDVEDEKGLPRQKRVSGMANFPKKGSGTYPIIVMFRGFVPKEKYSIGEGTKHAGEVLAQNGFITLAPDFLGYGESASPSANSVEERFQTYTTALTLLASIKNFNNAIEKIQCDSISKTTKFPILQPVFASTKEINKNDCIKNIQADSNKIGIWGHSNGGHIAISVLEISSKNYPTVLWAPVSKPFPYSVLYFTDEFDDNGKALRKVIADFEKDYDIEKYSPANYLNWINAPIQLHQGGADEDVPKSWSDSFYNQATKLNIDMTYFVYPLQDHNFSNSKDWSNAILRSIDFYNKSF